MNQKTILVTGASGFVGKPLTLELKAQGFNVRQTTRDRRLEDGKNILYIDKIGSETDWTSALDGVDIVIHLAARVHVMNENADNALDLYREVNTYGTIKLAQEAVRFGVKKFIFISSVKVNGEVSKTPFTETSIPSPVDPYGVSKFEAEEMLKKILHNKLMDLIILRPPLIYGPNASGNLARMIKLVKRGLPLPFGAVNNKRTMLYLNNLIDLLIHIIKFETKINDTFLAADRESISTKDLIEYIGLGLRKKQNIFKIPVFYLRALGKIFGKAEEIQRLTSDLEIDISYLNQKLGWIPPYSPKRGVAETAEWYK